MVLLKIIERPNKSISNILLFIASFTFIFLLPLFPGDWSFIINDILFSILFLVGVYALEHVRKSLMIVAIVAFMSQWIASIFHMEVIKFISELINIIFLQLIIVRLIIQVARSKKVNTDVIFESINGYLLMGVLFATWVSLLLHFIPNAFNGLDTGALNSQEVLYFTFVTMTTLGYGEITPIVPAAKSLSILISTSGQLYIAIIIAMLVGKFSASQQTTKD